jgi:hypothetical protein
MFDLPMQNEELTEDFCLLQLWVDFRQRVGKIQELLQIIWSSRGFISTTRSRFDLR